MMIRPSRVLLVAMAMLLASLVASPYADAEKKRSSRAANQKGIAYRWVDDKGVVHYGDRLPAHSEDTENSVLNRQGVEIRRNEGPKTPEEMAVERERQQQVVRQKQHDRFLMATYASVADIERLRDERLQQIQGQRGAAEQYVENLFSRLSALQNRAMVFKPYSASPSARRMPDDLAEDLVRTLNEMRVQRGALATKDEEEALLRSQFEADIARYRELHATRLTR
jgi:hypothetical protein